MTAGDEAHGHKVKAAGPAEREQAARKAAAETAKIEAEASKAKTEARSSALSAEFPAPTVKAPEGTVEMGDKPGVVADLIARSMLDGAAECIATAIGGECKCGRVLMVDSPDLVGSDWPYVAISKQIEQHSAALEGVEAKLEEARPTPPAVDGGGASTPRESLSEQLAAPDLVSEAYSGATSVIGGIADVVSMFRGDYKIVTGDVTIGSPPLFAAIAKRLLPMVETLNLDGLSLLSDSELFGAFNAAADRRSGVQKLAVELKELAVRPANREVERAKAAREAYDEALAQHDPPPDANLAALKERAEKLEGSVQGQAERFAPARAAVAVAETAIARFDEFATSILKAPDSGYPPLVAAAIRERLHSGEGRYTHVLYATIEGAGGEAISRRTIFRSTVRYLGGAQVSYLLWNVGEGKLQAADTMPVLGEAKAGLCRGFKGRAGTAQVTPVTLGEPGGSAARR